MNPPPDPAAWRRLKEVFNGAIALPPSRRSDYLDAACDGDPDLRREVEGLLASHDAAGTFIDTPAAASYDAEMTANFAGRQVGPYQLLSLEGAGGMGEVYKARDTRLSRTVAVKVLPADVGRDPHARERFEREARAVAALNHPHICTLHDIGYEDGLDFLVMEYVDGETLAARLAKGPLSVELAIQYAVQIASALDAAHRAGIVHRDLKPGNVMLTKAGPKLLDFGLAKSFPSVVAAGATHLPPEPDLTTRGTILGTMQYMAPEQLEGKEADARTDVFAFGAVLFEMLTGKKAFEGSNPASLIAAILDQGPPRVSSLQSVAPPSLDHVLERCLVKDPDDRWQSIRDVVIELQWIAQRLDTGDLPSGAPRARRKVRLSGTPAVQPDPQSAVAGSQTDPSPHRWTRTAIGLVLLLACAAGASALLLLRPGPIQPVRRLSLILPPGVVIYPTGGPFISPDGRRLLVVGEEADKSRLWLRDLDRDAFEPLEGTEGATFPFWALDGDRVGFFAERKLKKVSLDGGVVETICDVFQGRGGAWGADGTIVFAAWTNAGLSRVSAAGRPSPLTQIASDDVSHRFPVFLPDGRHFLFTVTKPLGRSEIALASLDNPTPIPLLTDASDPAYTRDGHLWFVRNRAVFAQAFDSATHMLRGTPVTVVTKVGYATVNHHADYSVANDGTLAYAVDAGREALTWIDRATGRLEHVADNESLGFNWRVSPDGERIAYSPWTPDSPQGGLIVWDTKRGVKTRLLPDVNVWCIAWSPAGDRLAVSGRRNIESVVVAISLGGAHDTQTLVRQSESACVTTWTPDRRYVLVINGRPPSMTAVAVAPDSPPLTLEPALPRGAGRAAISPDGRWIVYSVREGARVEGYIQRFPPDGRASKFTPDEVIDPAWRRDGAEIFYEDPMYSVKSVRVIVSSKGELSASAPSIAVRRAGAATGLVPFFVSSDGQRILTLAESPGVTSRRMLSLILNWPALLSEKR